MRKQITLGIILIFINSCIADNYENCPDYGKYQIIFTDTTSIYCSSSNYMNLYYSRQTDELIASGYIYTYSNENEFFHSERKFKLYPGNYIFTSLLCSSAINYNQDKPLKNGCRYLYSTGTHSVLKRKENFAMLRHNLINSMLLIKCIKEGGIPDSITNIQISPPVEKDAIINIHNGICNQEKNISSYLENIFHDASTDEWYFYCNPLEPGHDITIKITLINTTKQSYTNLNTRVFLNNGFQQGKIHTLLLMITPTHIHLLSTGITDWEDHYYNTVVDI